MEWESYFNRYKNRILNGAIVVMAVIISFNIYKTQRIAIDSLKREKEKEMKKNDILSSVSQSDNRLKSYKDLLNKKNISLVIDNIANIAKDINVKIVSIRPAPEEAYTVYIKYTFNLTVNVNDYKAIGRFIGKLESSEDVYMIDLLTISPQFTEEGKVFKGLVLNLKISTFLYKD